MWNNYVLLPALCKQMQLFHILFTEPGEGYFRGSLYAYWRFSKYFYQEIAMDLYFQLRNDSQRAILWITAKWQAENGGNPCFHVLLFPPPSKNALTILSATRSLLGADQAILSRLLCLIQPIPLHFGMSLCSLMRQIRPVQVCSKRWTPGCVKRSCVLLPTEGKQNATFSPNVTQLGAHLLEHPWMPCIKGEMVSYKSQFYKIVSETCPKNTYQPVYRFTNPTERVYRD